MQPAHYANYDDSNNLVTEEEDKKCKKCQKVKMTMLYNDPNSIYVGLWIYTHRDVAAVVVGHLKPADDEVKHQKNCIFLFFTFRALA